MTASERRVPGSCQEHSDIFQEIRSDLKTPPRLEYPTTIELRITPSELLLRGFQVDNLNWPTSAQHAQERWAVPIAKPEAA